MTNLYYHAESVCMLAIILMLIALSGVLVQGYKTILIPETICTAIAPNGWHEVDFDYQNRTCTFASDKTDSVITGKYKYDSTRNKYLLYEVEA